jgi:hypothetical protein
MGVIKFIPISFKMQNKKKTKSKRVSKKTKKDFENKMLKVFYK